MREAGMSLMQIAQRVDHGNKTVRHQNITAPVEKDSSAPRQSGIETNRHRIFFQTNVKCNQSIIDLNIL